MNGGAHEFKTDKSNCCWPAYLSLFRRQKDCQNFQKMAPKRRRQAGKKRAVDEVAAEPAAAYVATVVSVH